MSVMVPGNFKTTILRYGAVFFCAAVFVFLHFQSSFFPSYSPRVTEKSQVNVSNLEITVPMVKISGVAPGALWGMKETVARAVETDLFTSSVWDIQKDIKGWTLRNRETPEEIWGFKGVILVDKEKASVLYCEKCEERWKLVKEGDYFFDLLVRSVTSSTVMIEDTNNGKQWSLDQFTVEIPILEKP